MKSATTYLAIIALSVALFAFTSTAKSQNNSADIVDLAVQTESLSTLVEAVKAGGLVETLKGEGPFTVFAPTNEAFEKLPDGTVDDLLKPENKDKLAKILTYHVVPAKASSEAAMKMIEDDGGKHPAPTVAGENITLGMDGDNI